jgi:hypothetical protein
MTAKFASGRCEHRTHDGNRRMASSLEARNGASIRNDKPIATNAKGERTLAVWRPTD